MQFALDPSGGLWITLYIVEALAVAYSMTWVCKRGRARRAGSTAQ